MLAGLELPANWTSLVACLEGLLAAARRRRAPEGLTASQWLMGVSGCAFRLCIDAMLTPEGPAEFNFHELFPLVEPATGLYLQHLRVQAGAAGLEEARAEAWRRIAASLDRGWPAILYEAAGVAEFGLVVGMGPPRQLYALTLRHRQDPQAFDLDQTPAPDRPWSRLELVTAVAVEEPAVGSREAAVRAVRWAVDHAYAPSSRDGWFHYGLKAWDLWRGHLAMPVQRPEAAVNHGYHAQVVRHARLDAAAFCAWGAQQLGAPALREAAAAYQEVAAALDGFLSLIPYPQGADLGDAALRRAAQDHLLAARKAEERAVACLEMALRQLR